MPYSPLLKGQRCNPPNWKRVQYSQAESRELKLIPETTFIVHYQTTWHHNCPWKTLRDSWNIIYTLFSAETVGMVIDLYSTGNGSVQEATALKERLLKVKENFGPTSDKSSSETSESWISKFRDEEALGGKPEEEQLTSDHSENLGMIVAWQKYNIVEGPKESLRTDDPGSDAFDDFRAIDATLRARFQTVYDFDETLTGLVKRFSTYARKKCDLGADGSIAKEETLLKSALLKIEAYKNEPLVNFDMKYWRVVTEGEPPKPKVKNVDGLDYHLTQKNNVG